MTIMAYRPIEDYGIIGDLHTAALVSVRGSIDFMCFPRFDSPTLFGAMLDDRKGGCFQLSPVIEGLRTKQFYLPDSVILLTLFLAHEGVAELSDFMPINDLGHSHDLVRRVKSVRGDIRFRMEFRPRFDYGRSPHQATRDGDSLVFASRGPDRTTVRLRGTVPLRLENGDAFAEFTLRADETASFVLEEVEEGVESPSSAKDYVSEAFKETMNFWQTWVARSRFQGRWRQTVDRSAMTLKLLTHAPTGALVAAPTFGLPEEVGGVRNWDYRYTWIRDASFTLYALMEMGYTTEAAGFMRWIEARCRELEPGMPLQVMYGIDGRHELSESSLDHWEGYRGSNPVRIGNGASKQKQLDIYGELLESVYIFNQLEPISYDFWKHLAQLVNWVCDHWREPDYGIWEVRGGAYPFLHSRVMCWVAIDRGLRLARTRSFPAPRERWFRARDEIYQNVYEDFWDEELGSFVQFQGSKAVDASALLLPLVGFIGPNDPRWRSTLKVINERLVHDVLVKRYDSLQAASDGLPGREGAFCACSFWNVECMARSGDLKMARLQFEKMLAYANHLGLYSEEIGLAGEHLGNFPQAFTHLGLICAAHCLDRELTTASHQTPQPDKRRPPG